jgi:hypothetical protein
VAPALIEQVDQGKSLITATDFQLVLDEYFYSVFFTIGRSLGLHHADEMHQIPISLLCFHWYLDSVDITFDGEYYRTAGLEQNGIAGAPYGHKE